MLVEMIHEEHKEKYPKGKRIIIFVGPEGSGKSTQGKLLAKDLNYPYISTGDIIREKAKSDTGPVGDACRKMIAEHTYLEPSLLNQLLIERLLVEDTLGGAVIDGALRTLKETEDFDDTLDLAGKSDFAINVVFLNVPEELGIKRRLESSALRPGETRETILKRLEKYHLNLEERMKIVKERYNFVEIDGSNEELKVHVEVIDIFVK